MDIEGTALGVVEGAVAAIVTGRGVFTLGVGTGRSGTGGSNTLGEARAGRGVFKREGLAGRWSERGVGGGRGKGGMGGNTGVVDLERSGLVPSKLALAGHTLGASTGGTGDGEGVGSMGEVSLLRILAISIYAFLVGEPNWRDGYAGVCGRFSRRVKRSSAVCRRYSSCPTFGNGTEEWNHSTVTLSLTD